MANNVADTEIKKYHMKVKKCIFYEIPFRLLHEIIFLFYILDFIYRLDKFYYKNSNIAIK